MNNEERRKLKQIGSLCYQLAEVIDEGVDLFIAERPHLARLVAEKDPWFKPNLEDLESRTGSNETQFKVTEELLRKKIDEWLKKYRGEKVKYLFGKPIEGGQLFSNSNQVEGVFEIAQEVFK